VGVSAAADARSAGAGAGCLVNRSPSQSALAPSLPPIELPLVPRRRHCILSRPLPPAAAPALHDPDDTFFIVAFLLPLLLASYFVAWRAMSFLAIPSLVP